MRKHQWTAPLKRIDKQLEGGEQIAVPMQAVSLTREEEEKHHRRAQRRG